MHGFAAETCTKSNRLLCKKYIKNSITRRKGILLNVPVFESKQSVR